MLISILDQPYYAVGPRLTENIFPVGLHRPFTDEQGFRDLPVGVFLFYQPQHIQLPAGQPDGCAFLPFLIFHILIGLIIQWRTSPTLAESNVL